MQISPEISEILASNCAIQPYDNIVTCYLHLASIWNIVFAIKGAVRNVECIQL